MTNEFLKKLSDNYQSIIDNCLKSESGSFFSSFKNKIDQI